MKTRTSNLLRSDIVDKITSLVSAHSHRLIVLPTTVGMGTKEFLASLVGSLPSERTFELSVFPWERDKPGALLAQVPDTAAPILVIHEFDQADEDSFHALIAAAKRGSTTIIASVSSNRVHHFADEVVTLPPLTMRETDQFVRLITGHKLPALLVEELYLASRGRPEFIAEILDEAPRDSWSRPDATLAIPASWHDDFAVQTASLGPDTREALYARPLQAEDLREAIEAGLIDLRPSEQGRAPIFRDPRFAAITEAATPTSPRATNPVTREKLLLQKASSHSWHLDLASTELFLQDCTGIVDVEQRDSLTGYIALYGGHRNQATAFLRQTTNSADQSANGSVFDLSNWDFHAVSQRSAHIMSITDPTSEHHEEAKIHHAFAHHVLTGEQPQRSPEFNHAISRERANLFAGWTALADDDPNSARVKLRHVPGGALSVGMWRDAILARTLYVTGEWKAAKEVVERGLSACELNGIALLQPLLLWTGAQIAAMEGNEALANSYMKRINVGNDSFLIQRLPAAMGKMIVAASVSDLPIALDASAELARTVDGVDLFHAGYWPWEDVYAQTLIRAGRIDEADQIITEANDRSRSLHLNSVFAKNAVPRASIMMQRGQTTKAFSLFDDAVDSIEHSDMPAYAARVLFEYGLVLRRGGRRSFADEILRRASDLFLDMGAHAMVERCNQERRISGVGGHVQSKLGLTAKEEQVAHLAVEGTTNREIARQLTIAPKTVEYHLTHVYKKLGVKGREELAAVLK
ncbi:LuxR C-terminal-related transcriptional regulator [Corynebacterium sp. S7]